MNRRNFVGALAVPFGIVLALGADDVRAHSNPRRRVRTRLHVRRRIRRRAFIRVRFGRPFWVVPVGLAVGWELWRPDRVMVVRETRIIEKRGVKSEIAVVRDSAGKTEQVEIIREDSPENANDLEGSVLDEGDTTTPASESESR